MPLEDWWAGLPCPGLAGQLCLPPGPERLSEKECAKHLAGETHSTRGSPHNSHQSPKGCLRSQQSEVERVVVSTIQQPVDSSKHPVHQCSSMSKTQAIGKLDS